MYNYLKINQSEKSWCMWLCIFNKQGFTQQQRNIVNLILAQYCYNKMGQDILIINFKGI